MISSTRFWHASAAPWAALIIGLSTFNTNALTLGKVRVQSALGQNLVAEIDITDLSEEDAKSIKTALASPSAFVAMGLEYNPSLNGAQIVLQRRSNGNRYLKLSNSKPLNDPFVDIVVELSWASGRMVRTYTILLDPPKVPENTASTALPPSALDTPTVATAPAVPAAPAALAVPAASATVSAITPNTAATTTGSAPEPAPLTATSEDKRVRVRVRSGDTAGKIARTLAPSGVSIEQMLVALMSANPAAFSNGNVNRLVANAELIAPDAALAKKTSKGEARRIIERQSQEFQKFRLNLAGQVMAAPAKSKSPEAAVTVPDAAQQSPAKLAPSDKLKLSIESMQDKAEKASVDQIAQQRAKNEATERARELAKNIEELNQLAKVAAKPAVAATATEPAPSSGMAASEPAKAASSTAAVAVAIAPTPAPTSGDWLDQASQNKAAWGALLAVLSAIGGLVWYRKKQVQQAQSTEQNGHGHWDAGVSTAFDIGGGRRVDTTEAGTTGLSTTMYPDSQLELANELDPVAEAEVYLAYGKDVPAEEILKEGLQQDPTRVAIHLKLLGIFAKRRDSNSFDAMAAEVLALVQGTGPEWALVQEMGRSLSPANPLYGVQSTPTGAHDASASNGSNFQQSLFSLDAESLHTLSPGHAEPDVGSSKTDAKNQVPQAHSSAWASDIATKPMSSVELGASLDLLTPVMDSLAGSQGAVTPSTDRLDATLALAEQFLEIGEKEGACALLEEVIAGNSEPLRKRAKILLAQVQ